MNKEIKKISIHDGIFHADEIFAVETLRRIFEVSLVRTRDIKKLDQSDMRVDVGGKDQPDTGDYDHHQKGFDRKRLNGIPYAAFGLVWRIFGERVCGSKEVADMVDRNLVSAIDALDNGISLWDTAQAVQPSTISRAISSCNPSWHESISVDVAFELACSIAKIVLEREIIRAQGVVLAKSEVEKAVSTSSDGIMILERFVPWQESLFGIENSHIKYVVFKNVIGQWNCQCVPTKQGGFEYRKPFPANWGGLNERELTAYTGVSDAVFCHKGLFICGAKSRDGAIKLAQLSMNQ